MTAPTASWFLRLFTSSKCWTRSRPAITPLGTTRSGVRHETPAPIGQKAQPATDRRSRKTAEAVNKNVARAQVRASSLSIPRGTAAVIALDRRTWDRAIGAEYAAVASEGFKPHPAAQAVIKEQIGRASCRERV